MLKPLPCPFCGKLPKVGPINPEISGNAFGYVKCVNKRCAIFGACVRDGSRIADERGSDKYKDLAIRRWNRRNK
ncbi:MAG TPA: hypothetical protein ENH82_14790 [bacterium]|nr:hypothetical protein [bacterium]